MTFAFPTQLMNWFDYKSFSRIGVDRALGFIYPEDKVKKDDKQPVEFKKDNIPRLKYLLQEKRLFENVNDKNFVQMIMKMKLNSRSTRRKLEDCISSTEWPKWVSDENKRESLWNVLEQRMDELLKLLPFYEIEPKNSPQKSPTPRDGHG